MGGKVTGYKFRTKSKGWGMALEYECNGRTYISRTVSDPYGYAFMKGQTYRECCYNCEYAKEERVGDITLGDYWGILREHPEFYTETGVSAALINTRRGAELFEKAKPYIEYIDTDAEKKGYFLIFTLLLFLIFTLLYTAGGNTA